jgi:hypothetical protein
LLDSAKTGYSLGGNKNNYHYAGMREAQHNDISYFFKYEEELNIDGVSN